VKGSYKKLVVKSESDDLNQLAIPLCHFIIICKFSVILLLFVSLVSFYYYL